MSVNNLKIRLEKHAMWLIDKTKGLRFVAENREDLRFVDLSSADLRYADLSSANLRYANLRSANLSSADLSSADLSFADLRYANLRSVDLSSADGFKFKPLQIVNTKYFITILDDTVLWGCMKLTFAELHAFKFKSCQDDSWDVDEVKMNKKIVTEMIRYYRSETK